MQRKGGVDFIADSFVFNNFHKSHQVAKRDWATNNDPGAIINHVINIPESHWVAKWKMD